MLNKGGRDAALPCSCFLAQEARTMARGSLGPKSIEACGSRLQRGATRLYSFVTPQKLISMPMAVFSSGVAFQ